MPSHIYSMVGMWQESIASNLVCARSRAGYVHGYDFIIYAYLQLAQDVKAKAAAEKAAAAVRDKIAFVGSPLGVDTAIASIPARLRARNRGLERCRRAARCTKRRFRPPIH